MDFEAIDSAVGLPGRAARRRRALLNVAAMDRLQWVSQTRYRVVIAEDEALIRLDLKEMLEDPGQDTYVVVGEAADGEIAIQLAEQLRPDLVIMDIKMPVLDGISAAEQITSQPARAGRDPDRLLAARAGAARQQRRLGDGLPRQAVHQGRARSGD